MGLCVEPDPPSAAAAAPVAGSSTTPPGGKGSRAANTVGDARKTSWRVVQPRAAISYLLCMCEIIEQMADSGQEPTAIYVCSSGSTGSGLALAKAVLGLRR